MQDVSELHSAATTGTSQYSRGFARLTTETWTHICVFLVDLQ